MNDLSGKLVIVAAIGLIPVLGACGSSSNSPATRGATIDINATDTTCDLSSNTVASGSTTFGVSNKGSQVTEVYVYAKNGDAFTTIVSEVENIGPGTSRSMSADLAAGAYEIACKPGQTGSGIRTTLTVTGSGPSASSATSASSTMPAKVIELRTNGATLGGLNGQGGITGERIEFKVANSASTERIFEVKRPDGTVAGEVEIPAGKTSELYVNLDIAGGWLLIVEGGTTDITSPFAVS